MADKPIKILLIEDSPGDIRLIQEMLQETGHDQFMLEYAVNLSNGLQRLREDNFKVVLLDLGLPDSNGLETLHRVRDYVPTISVVMILTGLDSEQVGIQALREGADDYLIKGQVNARGLNRALRYSIERKQVEIALRKEKEKVQQYLDIAGAMFLVLNTDQTVGLVNKKTAAVLGYSEPELIGKNWFDIFIPVRIRNEVITVFNQLIAGDLKSAEYYENPVVTKSGEERLISWHNTVIKNDAGSIIGTLGSGEDITDRKRAEKNTLTFAELGLELAKASTLPELAVPVAKAVDTLLAYDAFFFSQRLPGGEMFTIIYAEDIIEGKRQVVLTDDVSIDIYRPLGHLLEGEPYLLNRKSEDTVENWQRFGDEFRPSASLLYAPVCFGDEVCGLLSAQSYTPQRYQAADLAVLKSIADSIAPALRRVQMENILRDSEKEFHSLAEAMPQIVWITRSDGWNIYFNQQWVDYTGQTLEESYGHGWNKPFHPDDQQRAWDAWQNATKNNAIYSLECRLRRADGVYKWWLIRGVPLLGERGTILKWFGTCTDIDELKQAEESLLTSKTQLANAMEIARLGGWEYEVGKDLFTFNDQFYKIFHTTAEQVGGYTMSSTEYALNFVHPEDIDMVANEVQQVILSPDPSYSRILEHRIRYADGGVGWISVKFFTIKDSQGKTIKTYGVNQDITDRKHAEERQQLAIGILQILNRANNLYKIIEDILKYVQTALHYDAVGIRLRDGDDYPYYVQSGFADEFLLEENFLCAKDKEGILLRDANGKPYLECMCGNIISGRTDPSKPFFTQGGSFWTNSTTDLLASTTDADRQTRTRNRCNTAGYESVAFIPLRAKDEIIGLLQLNDRKPNRFSLELIEFFEGLSPTIGIAVTRREAEEKLQQSYAKSKRILEETIQSLSSALETRDPYTAGHERRDALLACAIAKEMGLSDDQIEGLRIASLLHDIGKMSVPAEILSKPTKLTAIEFSLIKVHPEVGYTILKEIEFPWPIAQIVYQHQERLDGSGYPRGLKGDEIILEARILAVADVVEAMSSHRPYRPALGLIPALDEINKNKGILYDPQAVDACLRVFQENGFKFE